MHGGRARAIGAIFYSQNQENVHNMFLHSCTCSSRARFGIKTTHLNGLKEEEEVEVSTAVAAEEGETS